MTTRIKLLAFMGFLGISAMASGQQLSLDDCIRIAMENNVQVQNSKLEEKSTDYKIKEVKSALMPTIDASGQYQYYQELPKQFIPASAFGGPDGQYHKAALGVPQNTTGNIQIKGNIYNQSVLTGLKAARAAKDASVLQTELTKEEIVYNVCAMYYTIQVLNDNLVRLSDNIANLEQTVKVNENLKKNDLISTNVYNRLLINLENLRNQYENQKLARDKNMTSLKYLLNKSSNDSMSVAPFAYEESKTEVKAGDISKRADIRMQQAQIKLAEYDRKTVEAGYYPTLTSSASHSFSGFNDEFKPTKNINNDWVYSSYVAISIKMPIFDGFQKKNQLHQKDIVIHKNNNNLSVMKINAEREMRDAVNNYVTNKNLVESNKVSLDVAQQLFNDAQLAYSNDITTITDLLNAQNDLTNARTNYSNALLNLKLAELELKKANGELIK